MGFIEEMAKAKAYDKMQSKQVEDTMYAASKALDEQKAKEASMNKVFNELVGKGLAGMSTGNIQQQPNQLQTATPSVVPAQGLANTLAR